MHPAPPFTVVLHDNRFRTYDPATGRYVSADPIGQWGGTNTYVYGMSNPVSLTDPAGLFGFGALTAGGAFVGAVTVGGFELGRQLGRSGSVDDVDAVVDALIGGALVGGAIGFAADTYGLATGSYVTGITLSVGGDSVTIGLYQLINAAAGVLGGLGFVSGYHAGTSEAGASPTSTACEPSSGGNGLLANGDFSSGQAFFGFMGGLNTAGL